MISKVILDKNIFPHNSTSLTEGKEDIKKGIDNSTTCTKLNTEEVAKKMNTEEVAKKIKNLKKKLRQIDKLQVKADTGELKQLTIEQKEKLAGRGAILDEIKELKHT